MWNNVPKPVSSTYTTVNPQGREQYDQASLTYDDSSTYYDGVNMSVWNDVSKPSSSVWSLVPKPI